MPQARPTRAPGCQPREGVLRLHQDRERKRLHRNPSADERHDERPHAHAWIRDGRGEQRNRKQVRRARDRFNRNEEPGAMRSARRRCEKVAQVAGAKRERGRIELGEKP
jgi:hypothetical protein